MATYKNIKGFKIQSLASDPPAPIAGQVWYNTTTDALKGHGVLGAGTWASGGNMNSGREQGSYFGSQSAGVAAGGNVATNVEEYNGTAWSNVNVIPAGGVSGAGTGPQIAGIIYGWGHGPSGGSTNNTTNYDGTNWTEVGNLNTGRNVGGCAGGVQTSALYAGGTPPTIANTEIWNGTAWTEVADLATARANIAGFGTTLLGIACGGNTSPVQSITEEWTIPQTATNVTVDDA